MGTPVAAAQQVARPRAVGIAPYGERHLDLPDGRVGVRRQHNTGRKSGGRVRHWRRRRAAGIDVGRDTEPDGRVVDGKDRIAAGARDDRLRGLVVAAAKIVLVGREADSAAT